jgi:hypothetical protein
MLSIQGQLNGIFGEQSGTDTFFPPLLHFFTVIVTHSTDAPQFCLLITYLLQNINWKYKFSVTQRFIRVLNDRNLEYIFVVYKLSYV